MLSLSLKVFICVGEKIGCWVFFSFFMASYNAAGSTYNAAMGTAGGIMDNAGKLMGADHSRNYMGVDQAKNYDPYAAAQMELKDCKE